MFFVLLHDLLVRVYMEIPSCSSTHVPTPKLQVIFDSSTSDFDLWIWVVIGGESFQF